MIFWLGLGLINVILCLYDIYKQEHCKAVDLLATLVMFLAGPFATLLVIIHIKSDKIDNVLQRVIWSKHKSYLEVLEKEKQKYDYKRHK